MIILIAEDCHVTRKVLDLHLRKHGFDTILCENGRQALNYLEENSQISLIISDMMMPELSGLDLLKSVRANPVTQQIPFIMLTGNKERETVQSAILLGCNDYIGKPLNAGVLLPKVKKHLNLRDDWDVKPGGTQYSTIQ